MYAIRSYYDVLAETVAELGKTSDGLAIAYFRQMLEIVWRRWMTKALMQEWLAKGNFYRLQLTDRRTDNPDQRIAEDVAEFVSSTLTLFLDTLADIVRVFTFLGLLWGLSYNFV